MSISKDLETYKAVFGIENIVYSHTVTFIYKDNGKDRNLISSIFLTAENITVINTRYDLKYRIPLGDIVDFTTENKMLKYYVHLEYGRQSKRYNASIDFTTKGDGNTFITLLSLAVEVDRKTLDLENTYENEMTKIQEYKDKELKNINEEKRKIINNISNLKIENKKT
ncbi:delta endotoxin C-terminal domain-containing protein [Staphylococcus warneri]